MGVHRLFGKNVASTFQCPSLTFASQTCNLQQWFVSRDGFRERGAPGHLSFGGPKHMWPVWPFVWKAWKYALPMCSAHLRNPSFVLAILVLH